MNDNVNVSTGEKLKKIKAKITLELPLTDYEYSLWIRRNIMSPEERTSEHNYREMLKRNHLCTRCHQQDAYTLVGRSMCAECTARQKERSAKNYSCHKDEINQQRREKYSQMKLKDVCPRCGRKKLGLGDKVLCTCCRKKDALRKHKELSLKGVNLPRGDNGICWQCNKNKVMDGYRLCPECYGKLVEMSVNRKPPQSTHIWRQLNNNLRKEM